MSVASPAFDTMTSLPGQSPASLRPGELQPLAKNGTIELLRFASCVGIIWFHCKAPGAEVGYAALPILIALSVALAASPARSRDFRISLARRARRLLVPWIFWSCVYAVWRMAGAVVKRQSPLELFETHMLLTGPTIHLWYLPFAFVATTCSSGLRTVQSHVGRYSILGMCSATIVLLHLCRWAMHGDQLSIPLAQWTFGLPAVALGLALPQSHDSSQRRGDMLWVAFAILCACAPAVWHNAGRSLFLQYAIAVVCLGAAWSISIPASPLVERLGRLSFGIYLIHPFVMSVLGHVGLGSRDVLFVVMVVALSASLVVVLRRSPLKAVL